MPRHSRSYWRTVVHQSPKWQPVKSWRVWRDRWHIGFWRRVWLTFVHRPCQVVCERARLRYELKYETPEHVHEWGSKHTVHELRERNCRVSQKMFDEADLPICSGSVSYRWDNDTQSYAEIDQRVQVPCRY